MSDAASLAGLAGLAGFVWLAVFQGLLALGAPLGAMAWGGAHRVLPGRLRAASLSIACLAVLGALAVGQAGGIGPTVLPQIIVRPLLGAFAAVFALSLLGNAASRSRVERLHGVPLAFVLAVSCTVLALSAAGGQALPAASKSAIIVGSPASCASAKTSAACL